MEYVVIAYDGKDENALQRRLAVRGQHLEMAKQLIHEGKMLYGAAILDEKDNKMIGSVCIYNFNSRQEFDAWLKTEPYVTGNVWQQIEVKPCKVADILKKGDKK
jgi:uncharacterized protein